jgi:hypothetical protein
MTSRLLITLYNLAEVDGAPANSREFHKVEWISSPIASTEACL